MSASKFPTKPRGPIWQQELLKREDNLLGDAGLLSNLLDHRFRGRLLSPSNRRKATSLLLSLYKPEDGDAVLAELERFEKGTGLFSSDLVHKDMFPMTFWKRVFPDSVLASQAAVYCSLPATSASVERVWSAAAYQTQGRERLTTEHLFRELYVKMNS